MAIYKGKGLLQTTGRTSMAQIGAVASQSAGLFKNVTLTTSGSSQAVNWSNLNSPVFSFQENNTHELLKKYEVYESVESIITLACTAKRMLDEKKISMRLTDRDVYKHVQQEDRIMADAIKDYYSKKVMMWKLKGNGTLSRYREDMNKLIHGDGLTFRENQIGIAYWLPEFYEYDINMDSVKQQLTQNQDFLELDKKGHARVLKLNDKLTPIKAVNKRTKRVKNTEQWLKDNKYNAGVVITVENNNQLKPIWDKIFNTEKVLKIEGQFCRRHLDDFEYYSVTNWNLLEG